MTRAEADLLRGLFEVSQPASVELVKKWNEDAPCKQHQQPQKMRREANRFEGLRPRRCFGLHGLALSAMQDENSAAHDAFPPYHGCRRGGLGDRTVHPLATCSPTCCSLARLEPPAVCLSTHS